MSLLGLAFRVSEIDEIELLLQNGAIFDAECPSYFEHFDYMENPSANFQKVLKSISNDNFSPCECTRAAKLLLSSKGQALKARRS